MVCKLSDVQQTWDDACCAAISSPNFSVRTTACSTMRRSLSGHCALLWRKVNLGDLCVLLHHVTIRPPPRRMTTTQQEHATYPPMALRWNSHVPVRLLFPGVMGAP